jgi:hypothetical protein
MQYIHYADFALYGRKLAFEETMTAGNSKGMAEEQVTTFARRSYPVRFSR